jgi:cytochrome c oxidase subunit 3
MAASPYGPDVRRRQLALVLAMRLFLAALAMFFVAGMLGYVIIRVTLPASPAFGTIHVPFGLAISTVALLASSVTVHLALSAIRRERQARFQSMMLATSGLALVFLVIQVVCLSQLLADHWAVIENVEPSRRLQYYGIIFALVLVHGLHVLGGLVPLSIITTKALAGRYDHESYGGVVLFSMYWHFLDVIWLLMLGTFFLVG